MALALFQERATAAFGGAGNQVLGPEADTQVLGGYAALILREGRMVREELQDAVAAHALWKSRFRRAIETGSSEMTVEEVAATDRCEFGRWLQGLPQELEPGHAAHRDLVRAAHTEFHRAAAKVQELIATGHRAAAERALEPDSEFERRTAELTRAMMTWRRAE